MHTIKTVFPSTMDVTYIDDNVMKIFHYILYEYVYKYKLFYPLGRSVKVYKCDYILRNYV